MTKGCTHMTMLHTYTTGRNITANHYDGHTL